MAIEFHPTAESSGQFEVALETEPGGGFRVLQEVCSLKPNGSSPAAPDYRYRVEGGRVIEWPANDPPVASADSLYLVRVSGVPEFRPAYDTLSRIRICGFDPSRIPPVTPPRASDHLAADAGNLPSVIRRLQAESPEIREDIEIYLRSVLPSLSTVEAVAIGNFETLEFVLQTGTGVHRFPVSNISNGTLRALALLVAVLQPASNHGGTASLIGIEEPEKAIHPAAVAALGDAFLDASQATQVMVSTHSPDFLDNEAITSRNVIAVGIRDGVTHLGELDDFGRSVLRDGLFTLSELMRQNHLRPRLPASSVEPQPAGAVPRHDR